MSVEAEVFDIQKKLKKNIASNESVNSIKFVINKITFQEIYSIFILLFLG